MLSTQFTPHLRVPHRLNIYFLVVIGHIRSVQKRLERTNLGIRHPTSQSPLSQSLINRKRFLWTLNTMKTKQKHRLYCHCSRTPPRKTNKQQQQQQQQTNIKQQHNNNNKPNQTKKQQRNNKPQTNKQTRPSDETKNLVSRFGLAVSRGTSVRIRFGSPVSSKVVVCGHCLVTLSFTINETLKWFSSLPS